MVLITGCHRSGTSLLASVVGDVLGHHRDHEDEWAPAPENPRGYFESRQLSTFNEELLSALGGDWCHPPLLPPRWNEPPLLDQISAARHRFAAYACSRHWVDKDPRVCITLPALQHLLLCRVPVLGALREPLEVATSLQLRDGFAIERGLALWFLYNHHLAASLLSSDQLITYNELMVSPGEPKHAELLLDRLATFLQAHGYPVPAPQAWRQILTNRVDPSLNRAAHVAPDPDTTWLSPQLLNLVQEAYEQAATGVAGHRQAFGNLPRLILELCEQLELCAPGIKQHKRLQQLGRENEALRQQLESNKEEFRQQIEEEKEGSRQQIEREREGFRQQMEKDKQEYLREIANYQQKQPLRWLKQRLGWGKRTGHH